MSSAEVSLWRPISCCACSALSLPERCANVLQKLWKERLQGGRSAYQQESFFATHLFECLSIRILVYRRFTCCREIDGKAGAFL
jgi:hypothetical protein